MNFKTKEVLTMKANGLLVKQIASRMKLSRRTVEWHLHSACYELKALNSCHAVAIAVRDGLIFVAHIGCIAALCLLNLLNEFDTEARRPPSPPSARSSRRDTNLT